MDIRDQKLMQLLRKISSKVKPRNIKVLQYQIGDITNQVSNELFKALL